MAAATAYTDEQPAGAPLGWARPAALAFLTAFVTLCLVVAPILSVAVSMTWGISALLLAAVPVYVLAGLLLPEPD